MRTPLLVLIRRPWFVLGMLVVLLVGEARTAGAQPPGLTVQLTASHARIAAGGTLRVAIGAFNQGAPVPMDVYCVVLLPDGVNLFSLHGASMAAGRLDRLAALSPLVAGAILPTGFATTLTDFVTYTFTGAEPHGTYRFLLAALQPGALRDGRVDGGDLLALATRDVTLGPPLSTTVDTQYAGSGTATPEEGGTVTTTAADGTTYTLEVPVGAVQEPTTITLTPVTSVTGLRQPISRLAAVRAEPSGLQFARAARLIIDVPAGVPSTAMAALYISDGGTRGEITPVTAGGTRLMVQISHFSDLAIPLSAAELAAQLSPSGFFTTAVSLLPIAEANVPPFIDHLARWYDSHIKVLLQSGQGDQELLMEAVVEFTQWDRFRVWLEREFGGVIVDGRTARGRFTSRGVEGRTLAVTGFAQAFGRANDRCLAGSAVNARLADADTAARFAVLAQDSFDTIAANQALHPTAVQIASPDLAAHRLDAVSAVERLCVQLKIDDVVVPTLGPNQAGTLTVVAGVTFGGGPLRFSPAAGVSFCPNPDPNLPGCTNVRPTNAAGRVTFPVTASASGVVRYRVCALPSDARSGLFALIATSGRGPCRSSVSGVVVTPSQTQIAPGASRQFTVVVEGTPIQEVTWAVSGGGSITQAGLFTSNGSPGTFFVTATSVADPESVGIAQVTVTGSGGGGPEGPCPQGCTIAGTFTFCNQGNCTAPTQGSVTASTFRPRATDGRSGALAWTCEGQLITADITRSATTAGFSGNITRASSNTVNCRNVGTTVGTPLTGGLTAQALNFVLNVTANTTLTFESAAAVTEPARERR